jgi:hypothetical protein
MVKKKTGFFYYYFTRNIKQWALLTFVVPYNNIVPIIEIRNKETTRKKKENKEKVKERIGKFINKKCQKCWQFCKAYQ